MRCRWMNRITRINNVICYRHLGENRNCQIKNTKLVLSPNVAQGLSSLTMQIDALPKTQ